jgi:superfamily I DNA and RNA helicase
MRKGDWESIGYEVEGDFRTVGTPITITRPEDNSPNPLPQLWQDSLINFSVYDSRQEELMKLVEKLENNLINEQLKPREILIIALGDSASKTHNSYLLQQQIANFLLDQCINIYIPSALQVNQPSPKYPHNNPDLFWDNSNRGITITTVERAKGNEAEMVYLVGLDNLAHDESNFNCRNQFFVAVTRSKAWLELSGIGDFSLYDEVRKVMNSRNKFIFNL